MICPLYLRRGHRPLGRRCARHDGRQEQPSNQDWPGGSIAELLEFISDVEADREAALLLQWGAGKLRRDGFVRGVQPQQTIRISWYIFYFNK